MNAEITIDAAETFSQCKCSPEFDVALLWYANNEPAPFVVEFQYIHRRMASDFTKNAAQRLFYASFYVDR